MNIQIKIPEGFLNEEERIGYTVDSKMKRVWAVQLDLLHELKTVCEKYGLTYFADSGTLIGAIRHKGYIPWDDDIDIVMKRKDYEKLVAVAEKEFHHPYFLQSAHSEIFPRGYARLRNSDSTALTRFDFGKDINHGIFIDIFPLDLIPDDQEEMNRWLRRIIHLSSLIAMGSGSRNRKPDSRLYGIKRVIAKTVYAAVGYKKLIERYERLCGKYNDQDTKRISYVAYSKGKPKHIWESKCFQSGHKVPFEFTEIVIPDGYDSRLKTEYQDYMRIVRSGTTHGDMILDADTPYRAFLEAHSEDELKAWFNERRGEQR